MEQTEKRYAGWTNYETWAVALWLDNDEGSQNYWREVAEECRLAAPHAEQVKMGCWSVAEAARFTLADKLKTEFEEGSPLDEASLYSDLLRAALQEVNWSEMADNLLNE